MKRLEGYGLYTYVLIPHWSHKAAYLLEALFSTTGYSRRVRTPTYVNIMYIPVDEEPDQLSPKDQTNVFDFAYEIATRQYSYTLAEELLTSICNPKPPSLAEVCERPLRWTLPLHLH